MGPTLLHVMFIFLFRVNDYLPIALTSVIKYFERLVKDPITATLPNTLDTLQFAYCLNRSMDDAIVIAFHTALSHLNKKNTYVRILLIDYSSAFNTIVPSQFISKLRALDLNPSMCNWVLDLLTGRPQVVKVAHADPQHGGPTGVHAQPLLVLAVHP